MANTLMPHTRSTGPNARCPRVPLGVFLAAHPGGAATQLPAWHGLNPADIAVLVRTYTKLGDLIVDIDAHPTITAAAWYLHRVPATLDSTSGDERIRLLPTPPAQPAQPASGLDGGAALLLVTLPRPGITIGDRPAMVEALYHWRALLRPGGHLIVVPTVADPNGRISHRATVIARAHEVGLRWQQHLLIIAGPPDHEPRTEPSQAAIPARLLGGRHIAAHRTPLVFTTIEPEAVDA